MADIIINANMAIWSLQQITRGNETKVYQRRWNSRSGAGAVGCYYQFDGKPDCGVGQALAVLGVSVIALAAMDWEWVKGIYEVPIPGVYVTQHAREVYAKFQERQDVGMTWGCALEGAKQVKVEPVSAII